MAETNYNLTQYVRAIGSKTLAALSFLDSVRPTVQLADFSSLQPAHEPPLAAFGGTTPFLAAQFSSVEVVSLGPGGCFIGGFTIAGLTPVAFEVVVGPTLGLIAPQVHPPQTFSNTAPRSTVTSGRLAANPLGADDPLAFVHIGGIFQSINMFPDGVWIPRGNVVRLIADDAFTSFRFTVTLADVPASEGGD